ncbi:MAG: ATP-dependent helicase [Firmicutes bacterium HGW-Firmicutes-7]|nr:MAG: ATP-dependent helicase [Firmicutes bacterium HGW-Firmicutes-7]
MTNNFSSLGVTSSIIEAIKEMDIVTPTDVQQETIPHILKQKDLIVMSKTGSGKTGAFGIPILQSIDPKGYGPRGLILTPTRELAVQVDQDIKKMSKYLDIRTTAVYGQHDIKAEIHALKSGVSVVTGTPGRVSDHLRRKTLETKNIQFVVLDEADRMLDMGFIDQVVQIIKELPRKRVTLLFSATMPPEIQRICKSYMNQPITIELQSETKTVDTVKQVYYRVQSKEKCAQLNRLLKVEQPDRCMIFCNTRDEVDRVQVYLSRKGYITEGLHGANTQGHRMRTIQKFKEGKLKILVATDVAARGIHIEDLSLVINYDVPGDKNSYVHRIGRTARAGNSGKAITLATSEDIMSLYEIEEHVGVLLEEVELPTDAHVKECVDKMPQPKIHPKSEQQHEPKKSPIREQQQESKKPLIREQQPESKVSTIKEQQSIKSPIRAQQQEPKKRPIMEHQLEPHTRPQLPKTELSKREPKVEAPKAPKEKTKKGKEVTLILKNLGPVKVTYREEPKEKTSLKNLVSGIFKKEK